MNQKEEKARLRHVEYSRRYRKEHPGYAKECKKKWQEDNRDYLKIYNRIYRQEHEEKITKYKKEYRETHREYFKAASEKYAQAHPEKTLARVKRYQKTEKGRACMQRAWTKRRAGKSHIVNTLTSTEWLSILEQFEHKCAYCGKEFDLFNPPTKDHLVPISKGGNNTKENIVPACMACNARKHNKTITADSLRKEWKRQSDTKKDKG